MVLFLSSGDSTTSYGSYSGAVPNEKITWGKLDIDTPKYIVESDATIVAPLILPMSWVGKTIYKYDNFRLTSFFDKLK